LFSLKTKSFLTEAEANKIISLWEKQMVSNNSKCHIHNDTEIILSALVDSSKQSQHPPTSRQLHLALLALEGKIYN
jgi:hypothetical protein